jgi:CsoR family transcriptional regulator, copper-sensing transcriptional repressor
MMKTTVPPPAVHLSDEASHALRNRLRRLNGQVMGIERMLDEKKTADEILIQLAALKQAVGAASVALLRAHLEGCEEACADEPKSRHALESLKGALARVLKYA